MRYRFIDTHKKAWPINLMCGVLDVSRSGFYHWSGRKPSQQERSNRELDGRIRELFARHKHRYGVTSSSSWEPLRRAIEALTKVYFDRDDLVEKHAYYLEMIKWDDKCLPGQTFVKAKACPINPGIFGPDGRMIQLPAGIYVDDALMAAPGERYMKKLLAAAIEAIFAVSTNFYS